MGRGKAIDDLAVIISADVSGLAGDLRAASKNFEDFGRRVNKSGFGDVGDVRSAAKAAAEHRKAAGESRAAWSRAGAIGEASMAKMGGAITGAGVALMSVQSTGRGLADVFEHIKDSVRMAADVEQITLAFDVMLGSAEKAGEMVRNLRRFAADTPFNTKEVVSSGRALLAFGVDADQIIPTLRMLGDVSATIGKDLPLQQLSNEYGKIVNTQRAYARELYPMAIGGVPIYEELAKVMGKSVAEVKALGEEGKITRAEVAKAFIRMTSEGGMFYRATQRQAQTLSGLWETMTDQLDLVKVKFGQIIVEEAGLKDVVRDLEKFATRLEAGMDVQGLRAGIRLTADFAKGVAQVGYEFAKAGVQSADIFGRLGQDVPQFKNTFDSIQSIINDMKSFKIDPDKLAHFVIEMSKDALLNGAMLVDSAAKMGKAFKEDIIDPLVVAIGALKSLIGEIREAKASVANMWNRVPAASELMRGNTLELAARLKGDSILPLRIVPSGGAGGAKAVEPKDDDDFTNPLRDFAKTMRDVSNRLDKSGADLEYRLKAQKTDQAAEALAFKRISEAAEAKAHLDSERAIRRAIKSGDFMHLGMSPVDLMANLPGAAYGLGVDKASMSGLAFALQMATGSDVPGKMVAGDYKAGGVRPFGDDPRPGTADAARVLKEKYDPLAPGGRFDEHRKDLDDALKRGNITKEMHALGVRDSIKEIADKLGIGGPTQLPEAAMQGSAESVRILNQWMTGNSQATTEDLLRTIDEHIKQLLSVNQNMERNVAPAPVIMPLPR